MCRAATAGGRPPRRRSAERVRRRVTGGLRRYHEKHDGPVGDLHVTMPIWCARRIRPDGQQPDHADALRRPGRCRGTPSSGSRKPANAPAPCDERTVPTQLVAGILNLVPLALSVRCCGTSTSSPATFPASVPVPRRRPRSKYAFRPTIGAAVNVTLLTREHLRWVSTSTPRRSPFLTCSTSASRPVSTRCWRWANRVRPGRASGMTR